VANKDQGRKEKKKPSKLTPGEKKKRKQEKKNRK